jgi:hypothetical protein
LRIFDLVEQEKLVKKERVEQYPHLRVSESIWIQCTADSLTRAGAWADSIVMQRKLKIFKFKDRLVGYFNLSCR